MERDELERWLTGDDESAIPSPALVVRALGLPADRLAESTFVRTIDRVRCLGFILAALCDVFTEDADIEAWLSLPRNELAGRNAREALLRGQVEAVACLAVLTWNSNMDVAGAA